MANTPKVSVVTITYNQEEYIREALDSFVAQKANFDIEVVVSDDCSTDKTAEIIREYAGTHPNLFKPILRKANIGVQANMKSALQAATGKYIALCEGDDYWTDINKLQCQVDLLDASPDMALCFHPVKVKFEAGEEPDKIYPKREKDQVFDRLELLRGNYIQTNSVMYRRQNYEHLKTDLLPYDWYLHLYHAQFGRIGFIDRVMSVYRRHVGGLWWEQHRDMDGFWRKHGLAHLRLYTEFLNLYRGSIDYEQIIADKIGTVVNALSDIDRKSDDGLVRQALKDFPDAMGLYASSLTRAVRSREEEVKVLNHVIEDRDKIISQRDDEIRWIKNSKFWKLRGIIYRLIRKK